MGNQALRNCLKFWQCHWRFLATTCRFATLHIPEAAAAVAITAHWQHYKQTRLVVDRDKPMNSVMDGVWLRITNWTSHSLPLRLFKLPLIMFYSNMVDYPCSSSCFPPALTRDTFPTLSGTLGLYINFVLLLSPLKVIGWWWVAHKTLVTAHRTNTPFTFIFDF